MTDFRFPLIGTRASRFPRCWLRASFAVVEEPPAPSQPPFRPRKGEAFYRHRLVTRLTHWINAVLLLFLLMSGLQIFNAHPRLYWGEAGSDHDRPFIAMISERTPTGEVEGVTHIGRLTLRTTGILGVSDYDGRPLVRGFPGWATLPSWQDLASGRLWHFALAWLFVVNGALYLGFGLFSRHFTRDLALSRDELKPRHLWLDIREHLRFRSPRGEAARRYNPLQKIAYITTIFVLLPLMLLTGLTMSPGVNAAAPFLLDVFGGRQSARTLHFISAGLIVAFIVVHVGLVIWTGFFNNMRSMITGWFVIQPAGSAAGPRLRRRKDGEAT